MNTRVEHPRRLARRTKLNLQSADLTTRGDRFKEDDKKKCGLAGRDLPPAPVPLVDASLHHQKFPLLLSSPLTSFVS